MVTSKDYQDVARLGERIVKSLRSSLRDRGDHDLLTRWICHEVTESMAAVNKAKNARAHNQAVRAATDLILLLWEHRSDWPEGWPPKAVQTRLARLERRTSRWDPEPEPSGSVWFDAIRQLDLIEHNEYRLVLQVGLLEDGVEDVRALLDELPAKPYGEEDPEDIQTLKRQVALHDEAREWATNEGAETNAEVRALVEGEFRKLARDRRVLIQSLVKSPEPENA